MGYYQYHNRSKNNNKRIRVTKSRRGKDRRTKSRRRRVNRTRKGGIGIQLPSKDTQNMATSLMANDPRYIAANYAMKQSNKLANKAIGNIAQSKLIGSTIKPSNIINASNLASSGVPSFHNQYNSTTVSTRLPTTSD